MSKSIPILERVRTRVAPDGDCLVWLGWVDRNGYGKLLNGKRPVFAHRVSYESKHGPIPDGLVIDHLCRNPRCVKPEHLEAVTQRVNVLRGESPMAKQARQTHCIHGHEFTPANTYMRPDRHGRQCRACARDRRQARARLAK